MEEVEEAGIVQHQPSRQNFFALLHSREVGGASRQKMAQGSPQKFTRSVRGSSALISRLQLEGQHTWHNGCVNTISFTPSGNSLISGSDDRHIVIGDWQTGSVIHRWHSGHHNNVFQAKVMPFSNECTIVSCAADGQVRVSELQEGGEAVTRNLCQHRGRAHKLAVDPLSPNIVLSTGEDGYVQQMDLRMDHPSVELVRVGKTTARRGGFRVVGLNSIALNPANSHYFCTGGDDPICRVWDRRMLPYTPADEDDVCQPLHKLAPNHLMQAGRVSITSAVYAHDGHEIVASYNDEHIYLLDASGSRTDNGYLHQYQGHRNERTVKGVNLMGAGSEFVVSGSDCGHVFVWDKKSEDILVMHKGDEEVVNCLEPHPFLAVLATSGIGDDIKVWAPTGDPFSNFEGMHKQTKRNARRRDAPGRAANIPWALLLAGGAPRLTAAFGLDEPHSEEVGSSEDGDSSGEGDGSASGDDEEGESDGEEEGCDSDEEGSASDKGDGDGDSDDDDGGIVSGGGDGGGVEGGGSGEGEVGAGEGEEGGAAGSKRQRLGRGAGGSRLSRLLSDTAQRLRDIESSDEEQHEEKGGAMTQKKK